MNTEILLETRNLALGYRTGGRRRMVAEGLSLRLEAGRLVCLLGPNGAGKSTLLRTLAGLQPPLSGTLVLGGTALESLSPRERARRLALVLTEKLDAGHLHVDELVGMGRAPHTGWLGRLTPEDRAAVTRALEVAGCREHARRRLGELSDGERQKVLIARALAQETPLLLLDEPTAHLDLPNRLDILRMLKGLAAEAGKGILLSTHELDLALQAADEIWLLDASGTLAIGAPEDLVLDGSLEACFGGRGFAFDAIAGGFRLPRDGQACIGLEGEGPIVYWTRRALERNGFRAGAGAGAARRVRVVSSGDGAPGWTVDSQAGTEGPFRSLGDLVRALRELAARPRVEA